MEEKVDKYIKLHSKSQFVGFLLTILFGPLGLFYSSWIAALILTLIAIFTFATIVVPVLCWLISILFSFAAVHDFNKKLLAKAELMHG